MAARPTPEPRTVRLDGTDQPYILKRSPRRRTLALRVDHHGLTVLAPTRACLGEVEALLRHHAGWVREKLAARAAHPSLPWTDGTRLLYLGGDLPLHLTEGARRARIRLEGETLHLDLPDPKDTEAVRRAVERWYRREAQTLFAQRVTHFAARMGLAPPRLGLSGARTRWGSCNARGEIRLNWRLIQAPLSQIDYVVVHELAHIRELNHSPRFWAIVEETLPAYEDVRRALRRDGERYHRL